jgi:hypothetical protein
MSNISTFAPIGAEMRQVELKGFGETAMFIDNGVLENSPMISLELNLTIQ